MNECFGGLGTEQGDTVALCQGGDAEFSFFFNDFLLFARGNQDA